MPVRKWDAVRHFLKQLGMRVQGDGATDGQLLEQFVRGQDEAAFELLIWRHGTMVLNVCRRVLSREEDVEDASPLKDALDTLSRLSGTSIILDERLKEKAETRVTATFKSDVSVPDAVRIVADMADLHAVFLPTGGIYVTSPANAEKMLSQIEKRSKDDGAAK